LSYSELYFAKIFVQAVLLYKLVMSARLYNFPSFKTRMLSACFTVDSLWAITIIVRVPANSPIAFWISASVSTSTDAVASSNINIGVFLRTLWRWTNAVSALRKALRPFTYHGVIAFGKLHYKIMSLAIFAALTISSKEASLLP